MCVCIVRDSERYERNRTVTREPDSFSSSRLVKPCTKEPHSFSHTLLSSLLKRATQLLSSLLRLVNPCTK